MNINIELENKEQVHEKKDDVFLYMKILVELDCHASVATHASIVQETKNLFENYSTNETNE